jgi:hypothetical protein
MRADDGSHNTIGPHHFCTAAELWLREQFRNVASVNSFNDWVWVHWGTALWMHFEVQVI